MHCLGTYIIMSRKDNHLSLTMADEQKKIFHLNFLRDFLDFLALRKPTYFSCYICIQVVNPSPFGHVKVGGFSLP